MALCESDGSRQNPMTHNVSPEIDSSPAPARAARYTPSRRIRLGAHPG